MKLCKKLFAFVAAMILVVALAIPSMAAEPTTYTVRILSGAQGTYGGQQVYSGLNYGDKITVTINSGTVTVSDDSKYYVKGLKDAGKDNKHTTSASTAPNLTKGGDTYTITVEKDMDYVVTYGLKGTAVAYTVHYVDTNGNPLSDPEVYYGDVGDKPVVSCLYFEGYRPQALNLTKTLSEDEGTNVFTFVYTSTAVSSNQNNQQNQNGTTNGTNGTTGDNTANGGNAANGDNTAANGGTATDGDNGNAVQAEGERVELGGDEEAPRDLIDLDEEEVPLADNTISSGINGDNAVPGAVNSDGADAGQAAGGTQTLAKPLVIAIPIIIVVAVLAILLALMSKKKTK